MVIFQINEMEIQILVLFISMFDRIFFPYLYKDLYDK